MRYLALLTLMIAASGTAKATEQTCEGLLDHDARKLRSEQQINLCEAFAGKPLLIVNTASYCGFTPQFEGLEDLYQTYKAQGLAIVGVPSDDFRQAAASENEAAQVCYVNYGVTFTMLSQQSVKGRDAHPVFQELGRQAGEPNWNFNKYLVDRDGKVIARFDSRVKPMSDELRTAIEAVL